MHFKWNYEPPTPDEKKAADELAEKIGMTPVLASLLIRRGITTESAAKRFFAFLLILSLGTKRSIGVHILSEKAV